MKLNFIKNRGFIIGFFVGILLYFILHSGLVIKAYDSDFVLFSSAIISIPYDATVTLTLPIIFFVTKCANCAWLLKIVEILTAIVSSIIYGLIGYFINKLTIKRK